MTTINPPVLRPSQAAAYIGLSLPSFWRIAKADPSFPRPFKVGPNSTAVMRRDLDAWLESKRVA
ncbi:MAG: AlpA family phage regulatory protein [Castellaniella sp.]|uniref:helix-turn-helix transcriptional regulator n=1 Tax=Castellaniella sp. TaxID=1955812 RepID=UPI001222ED77|nr:AlpA family phage regulatory protein [Castellaniella sp.]TAN27281.1 MAG: AlpA family phage regulatory protein [Castellaniella sp.]